jgi:hypothetical protein
MLVSISPEHRNNSVANDREANRERLQAARARQRAIGRELRRMYDDVAHSPLPDEFHELLRKIDEVSEQSPKDHETKKMS